MKTEYGDFTRVVGGPVVEATQFLRKGCNSQDMVCDRSEAVVDGEGLAHEVREEMVVQPWGPSVVVDTEPVGRGRDVLQQSAVAGGLEHGCGHGCECEHEAQVPIEVEGPTAMVAEQELGPYLAEE